MEPFGRLIYPVEIHVCYLLSREHFGVSAKIRYSWKDIYSQILIIIIIIIKCNLVVTRWQWLFYIYTKYEIGFH